MKDATLQDQSIENRKAEIASLIAMYEKYIPQTEEHAVTQGKVVSLGKKDVVLDLGGKSDAILPLTEFKDLPTLKVGDQVEVYVVEKENKEGDIIVSRHMAKLIKSWEVIWQAYKNQTPLTCEIKRIIKGGLAADILGIETFLPSSQISTTPIADLDALIGTKRQVVVISINAVKNNVIVSHRKLIEKEEEEQRKKIIEGLEQGQILAGKVKNITHFGAFIDLGGIVALVHRNEMSWSKKPPTVEEVKDENGEPLFAIGNEIKAVVEKFDMETGNIYLSTRRLTPNPWDKFAKEVKEESTVKGKIKEIMNYGAFIELTDYPEVTGLLHVSDISHASYLDHPSEILQIGEELELMVLALDESNHDLRLGRKQLLPNPWDVEEIIEKYKPDTIHEAKVRLIIREGAYLILEDGIEGFVYNHHLSWTKKVYNASEILKKKDVVKVKILGVSKEKKLFELGLREVEENPWPTFVETFQVGSTHKGTIKRKVNGGAVVEMEYGLLTFVNHKELVKKDNSEYQEGEDLDFVILGCMPEKESLAISHTATFKKKTVGPSHTTPRKPVADKLLQFEENTKASTLGDFGELSKLREELRQKEQEEQKKAPKTKSKKT